MYNSYRENSMSMRRLLFVIMLIGAVLIPAAADSNFNFDLDVGIDYQEINGKSYIGANLQPDISIGKFGVGLKGSLFFELNIGGDPPVSVILDNWIPDFTGDVTLLDKVQTAAALYLPVFQYVRYGFKGDPLYIKFGKLESQTMGSGLFVTNYANTTIAGTDILGGVLDVDGRLFDFPYVGFEAFTANLAEFDVIAGRLYVRPLAFVDFPVIRDIQLGGTYAVDRNPALYSEDLSFDPAMVSMYGADVLMPILDTSFFKFVLFGDAGFQPDPEIPENVSVGYRTGFNGHILSFLTFNADLTFPTEGFKPDYFNAAYDVQRQDKYESAGISSDNYFLHAGAGFNLFQDSLVFDLDIASELSYLDGTFGVISPEMTAQLSLGEDVLGFVYFDAMYKKTQLADESLEAFLQDVISLKNAEIRANVSIKYSIVVLDTGYIIEFDSTGTMLEPQVLVGATVSLF